MKSLANSIETGATNNVGSTQMMMFGRLRKTLPNRDGR